MSFFASPASAVKPQTLKRARATAQTNANQSGVARMVFTDPKGNLHIEPDNPNALHPRETFFPDTVMILSDSD